MNIWLSKNFSTQFVNQSKKSRVDWSKEILQNTITMFRNTSITSWQVMNRIFTRMSPKVSSSRLYGCFKMSQIQQKLLAHEALPSKWSPVFFFGKTGQVAIVPLEQRRTVNSECYATICLPVVYQEIRKTKHWRRIPLHHRLEQLDFWALKTSIWWVNRRIVLTWHRMTIPVRKK